MGLSEPALEGLIAQLADELEDVTISRQDAVSTYERAGSAFARHSADALEVRLPEDIGEAALRTPDTATMPGQPGWIRFAPRSSERHVRDRAEAWFTTAWRHAGPT